MVACSCFYVMLVLCGCVLVALVWFDLRASDLLGGCRIIYGG
jgi:hypothetical protein